MYMRCFVLHALRLNARRQHALMALDLLNKRMSKEEIRAPQAGDVGLRPSSAASSSEGFVGPLGTQDVYAILAIAYHNALASVPRGVVLVRSGWNGSIWNSRKPRL